MDDLHNQITSSSSLNPSTRTTSANGASVDLQGYEMAEVIVSAGAWVDGTHAFSLEESSDNSTFTDVADGFIIGSEPTVSGSGGQNKTYRFGYYGSLRYIRVIVTVTGSPSTGLLAGAVILRGGRRTPPAAASA